MVLFCAKMLIFQSTLSVRRATSAGSLSPYRFSISIHALREESDLVELAFFAVDSISIHALREESDGRARNR